MPTNTQHEVCETGEREQALVTDSNITVQHTIKGGPSVSDSKVSEPETLTDANTPNETADGGQRVSDEQKKRLAELESKVRMFEDNAIVAGEALIEIQKGSLYKATHKTFKKYVRDSLDLSVTTAYRMIRHAELAAKVSPMGDEKQLPSPKNERQVRALAKLADDEDVCRAWAQACKEANGNRVTGVLVEKAVGKLIKDGARRATKERVHKQGDADHKDNRGENLLPPVERFVNGLEALREFAKTTEFAALSRDTKEMLRIKLADATKAIAEHEQPPLLNAA
jgi:hypothetical protein